MTHPVALPQSDPAAGPTGDVPEAAAEIPAKAPARPRAPWQLTVLAVLAILTALTVARVFLVPVVLAFLLALVFSPIRRWCERRGIAPGIAAAVIVLGLLALIALMTMLLAAPLSGWIDQAPQIGREVERKVRGLLGAAQAVIDASEQINEMAAGGGGEADEVVVREGGGVITSLALSAPMIVAQTLTVLVLLFFLTASGDMVYEKIVHVLPRFHDKRTAIRIVHDIERKLSRYLLTITIINLGLGVSVGLAFWVLGMPNPLLFAVLAFAFNFVPYVGAVAGTIVALLVGLVSFDEPAQAFVAAAAYYALTAFEGQFVTPHFVGRSLKLNTVVIFLSVTLWAWLWSVMGMLLAVPLLVTLRTICEHIPQLNGLGHFLAARGSEAEKDAEGEAPSATRA